MALQSRSRDAGGGVRDPFAAGRTPEATDAAGGVVRMVHVAESIVTVQEATAPKAAAAMADQGGDDAADAYEADQPDDEADPFRVRAREGKRGDHRRTDGSRVRGRSSSARV